MKRPGVFKLPSFKMRVKSAEAARRSQVATQETNAAERVIRNTPVLQAVYKFLARPLP